MQQVTWGQTSYTHLHGLKGIGMGIEIGDEAICSFHLSCQVCSWRVFLLVFLQHAAPHNLVKKSWGGTGCRLGNLYFLGKPGTDISEGSMTRYRLRLQSNIPLLVDVTGVDGSRQDCNPAMMTSCAETKTPLIQHDPVRAGYALLAVSLNRTEWGSSCETNVLLDTCMS